MSAATKVVKDYFALPELRDDTSWKLASRNGSEFTYERVKMTDDKHDDYGAAVRAFNASLQPGSDLDWQMSDQEALGNVDAATRHGGPHQFTIEELWRGSIQHGSRMTPEAHRTMVRFLINSGIPGE